MIDIIIPSCKQYEYLKLHTEMIKQNDPSPDFYNYIPTGFEMSASANRNYGLLRSFETQNKFIIMIDDDIGGFFPDWQQLLIKPLIDDPTIFITSARLITPEGELSPMMGADFDIDKPFSSVTKAVLSAAIAFRKEDIIHDETLRFEMTMIGSGYEDTLFCRIMTDVYKNAQFKVINNCRLIHYHEMKNQNQYLNINQKIYTDACRKRGICA